MRHEIMLPIELNTDAIEQKVERDAYEEVVDRITAECRKALPTRYRGGYNGADVPDWKLVTEGAVDRFLEANRDEIIGAAAKRLEERLARTKAMREAAEKAVRDE